MSESKGTDPQRERSVVVREPKVPQLPQEILELIVDESLDDLDTLAVLCRVSKNYARAARKHLYYELDLIAGDYEHAPVHPSKLSALSWEARRTRRLRMLETRHLWQHIKSLAISLHQPSRFSQSYDANTPYLQDLQTIQLCGVENVYIRFSTDERGRDKFREDPAAHFRVSQPTRQVLENLLSSNSLQRFTMEINSVWKEGGIFPGWIFRNLSSTARKVSIRTAYPSTRCLYAGNIDTIPATSSSHPKRQILEFDFANLPPSFDIEEGEDYDSVPRWWAILSGLCFNFDFSKIKRLSLPVMWNGTPFALPDGAARSLEVLTIRQFPNATEHVSLPTDHFSEYRSLHTLTLGLHLRGPLLKSSYCGCSSLVSLFSSHVPPSLRRIFLEVKLGTTAHGSFSLHALAPFSAQESATWRELDKVLSSKSSLRLFAVHLQWRQIKWSDCLEGADGTTQERKAAFDARLESMLEEWRMMFQETNKKGIFNLRYTYNVLPSTGFIP